MKKNIVLILILLILCTGCVNSKSTEQTPTGDEIFGQIYEPYLFYSNSLYVHDEPGEHIEMEESEIEEKYEGYEYVGNVADTTKETYPKEELQATDFGKEAKVYAKDDNVIIFYHGRIFEMTKLNK